AGGAASSFVIVRVAAVCAPRVAPLAPLIAKPTVSSFSKRASSQGVTLKVFDVPSVSAQLSVPLLLMKSTPGVHAAPPTAVPLEVAKLTAAGSAVPPVLVAVIVIAPPFSAPL